MCDETNGRAGKERVITHWLIALAIIRIRSKNKKKTKGKCPNPSVRRVSGDSCAHSRGTNGVSFGPNTSGLTKHPSVEAEPLPEDPDDRRENEIQVSRILGGSRVSTLSQ